MSSQVSPKRADRTETLRKSASLKRPAGAMRDKIVTQVGTCIIRKDGQGVRNAKAAAVARQFNHSLH